MESGDGTQLIQSASQSTDPLSATQLKISLSSKSPRAPRSPKSPGSPRVHGILKGSPRKKDRGSNSPRDGHPKKGKFDARDILFTFLCFYLTP